MKLRIRENADVTRWYGEQAEGDSGLIQLRLDFQRLPAVAARTVLQRATAEKGHANAYSN
jgi:hypothetical protein